MSKIMENLPAEIHSGSTVLANFFNRCQGQQIHSPMTTSIWWSLGSCVQICTKVSCINNNLWHLKNSNPWLLKLRRFSIHALSHVVRPHWRISLNARTLSDWRSITCSFWYKHHALPQTLKELQNRHKWEHASPNKKMEWELVFWIHTRMKWSCC